MVALEFEASFENWEEKLAVDEWYFANTLERLVKRLHPEAAFNAVDGVVVLALKQNNEFLALECLELLISLARQSQTTEVPSALDQAWCALEVHMKTFSDHSAGRFQELAKWYRKHAF